MSQHAGIKINSIVVQDGTLLDSITAVRLLRLYGESQFPGVSTAPLLFWDDVEAPDGLEPRNWKQDGRLYIGRGGADSPFDEHAGGDRPTRMPGECSATLVAKYLGIDERPNVERLLASVLMEDEQGNSGVKSVPVIIKWWHKMHEDPMPAIGWANEAIDALLADPMRMPHRKDPRKRLQLLYVLQAMKHSSDFSQEEQEDWELFARDVREEQKKFFAKAAAKVELSLDNSGATVDAPISCVPITQQEGDTSIKSYVVGARTDNQFMSQAIRHVLNKRGMKTAAVVIRRLANHSAIIMPGGSVQNLDMTPVIAAVRLAEMQKRGTMPTSITRGFSWVLRQEVEVPEAPGWQLHIGMVMNGSRTARERRTELNLQELVAATALGLGEDTYVSDFEKMCHKGECHSSLKRPCPAYHLRLKKCAVIRQARFKTKKKAHEVAGNNPSIVIT